MFADLEFQLISVVLGVALFEGGRRERLAALISSVHFAIYVFLMSEVSPDVETLSQTTAVQVILLPALVWLAWRYRTLWALVLAGLQVVVVVVWVITTLDDALRDLIHRLVFFGLEAAKAACLGWAAAVYVAASPRRPPGRGEPDIDLYETAKVGWPRYF